MTLPWHRLYQVSDLLNFVAEIRAMSGSESNNKSEFYLKKKQNSESGSLVSPLFPFNF